MVIVDASRATTAGWVTIAATKGAGRSSSVTRTSRLLIHVFETVGAQSIQYRVQASNDVDFDGVETLADVLGNVAWTVAASGSDFQTICDCWGWIRVQVTNGTGIGAARCIITGSN